MKIVIINEDEARERFTGGEPVGAVTYIEATAPEPDIAWHEAPDLVHGDDFDAMVADESTRWHRQYDPIVYVKPDPTEEQE